MALIFDPYHSCFTLSVLLSLWMDLVTGLITLNPQYPVVGQTVILNATRVTEQILSFTWYKGSDTVSTDLILTYYPALPTPQVPGAIYFDRANGLPDGSLQIRDLRITDKGEYRTQITVQSGVLPQESVYLFVYELLQTPTLTISSSRPLPGGNVTFHCDARNQTVSNYTFYRNQQRISCSPPHVICNYSSPYLSFYPITESDSGNYTCVIMNPFNSNTSNVIVIEKVSNMMLTSNTSGPVHVNKDSVSLTCSAHGTNVYYSWSMRGTALPSDPRYNLNQNNSSLIISPVTEADNGTFTCTASNFLNSATSSPLSLSWYPNGTIQCLADFIKDIVDLQCSWPGGNPAVELHLQFNNISMSGTNYIVSSIHQKDITLNTFLYCRGSQEKLIQTCSLDIDTPKSVGFNNDSTTEGILGNSVTLTLNLQNRGKRQASLHHVLPANFTWYKLTTDPSPLPSEKPFFVISTAYQSSLIINPVTKEVGGRYMCIATNPLGNTSFVFYLNVTEGSNGSSPSNFPPSAPPSGLSGGAIAGIVIGVLISVAIIAIIVFFIIKATKGSTNGERGPFTGHIYENTRSQSENTYSRTIPGTQQVEMSNSANPVPVYEQLMVKNEAVYNTIMPSYKK